MSLPTNVEIPWVIRTIRPQGPYGPQSSGGNTRCKIAQNHFLIQQRITAKRPGLACAHNAIKPASTSAIRSTISAQVGKKSMFLLNSITKPLSLPLDGLRNSRVNAQSSLVPEVG